MKCQKITNNKQSYNSYKEYKSDNWFTQTSEYIRGGIKCQEGTGIPYQTVASAVCPISNVKSIVKISVSKSDKRKNLQSKPTSSSYDGIIDDKEKIRLTWTLQNRVYACNNNKVLIHKSFWQNFWWHNPHWERYFSSRKVW
jgi:hypothetical protein